MAKKGARIFIGLQCSACNARNYTTEKNTTKTKDALSLRKFCSRCRKTIEHKEVKLK